MQQSLGRGSGLAAAEQALYLCLATYSIRYPRPAPGWPIIVSVDPAVAGPVRATRAPESDFAAHTTFSPE